MKLKKKIPILILILSVSFLFAGCQTTNKITKKDYEFCAGTWINEDYNSHPHFGKWVCRSDGTFDGYFKTTDKNIAESGHYVINEKWTDAEDNIWYKMNEWAGIKIEEDPSRYSLNKINSTGTVWEWISYSGEYPSELDTEDFLYHIYYRQ